MPSAISQAANNGNRKGLDMNSELILAALGGYGYLTSADPYLRALPRSIDDAERDFGLDIYERMLRDPALGSAVGALKVLAMSEGPRFLSPVSAPNPAKPDAEQAKNYARAEEIRASVESMFDKLQQPFEEILGELLDVLCFGHVVAEQTYEPKGGLLRLKTLRVKPRDAYAFAVNQFMDVLGLVPSRASVTASTSAAAIVSEENIIPREKFLILSYWPKCGDPRGTSLLRAAYNSWWLKQQTFPHFLKYLLQFGTPGVAGFLPEDPGYVEEEDPATGEVKINPDGSRAVIDAATDMLQKLIAWANGTAIVLPFGSKVDLIESKGDGEAYIKAFDFYDRQMVQAVLIAARATMEAQHGSKADSGTAKDLVGSFAQLIRRLVEVALYRDVIKPLVTYNWGEEAAEQMCPYMSLSGVDREDVATVGNAIASLARVPGMIHPSQYPGIDNMLGLPERDFASQMEEMAQEKADRDEIAHRAFGLAGSNVYAGADDSTEPDDDTVGNED